MGAVVDRLTITLLEMKVLLGMDALDTSLDTSLALLIAAGKELADQYLNNPFLDADGDELPIPAAIKLGLVDFIQSELDRPPEGAVYVKTGDIAVRYRDGNEFSEDTLRHWTPYRLAPFKEPGSTTVAWSLGAP